MVGAGAGNPQASIALDRALSAASMRAIGTECDILGAKLQTEVCQDAGMHVGVLTGLGSLRARSGNTLTAPTAPRPSPALLQPSAG